jgi:two-component system catabolic regulation response regulator CreB/two-component system response regulator ChvI
MNSVRNQNKILLVDDEPDITMAFKLTLEKAGFIVDTYQDPVVALSEFKPNSYDLVILDIKMPKMNGFELHAEMLKVYQHVKACFITVGEIYYDELRNGERKEIEKDEHYCKLDSERFLQKPISNVNLVKRIEKIMMLRESLGIAQ